MLAHPLALGADADNAQQVLRDFEAMLSGHGVLECFQFSRKELDDPAALGADHVIVMLMFVVVFVVRAAIAKANFARQTCFRQELQRAIDGGLTDAGIFLFDEPVKIFAGEVLLRAQEDVENQVALGGALEAFPLDVFEKDFLLFSHWLEQSCLRFCAL